jgi:hypothetical protein
MAWIATLVLIAILLAFNMFAADAIARLRRDVMEIHRAVVVPKDKDKIAPASTAPPSPAGAAPAGAAPAAPPAPAPATAEGHA